MQEEDRRWRRSIKDWFVQRAAREESGVVAEGGGGGLGGWGG